MLSFCKMTLFHKFYSNLDFLFCTNMCVSGGCLFAMVGWMDEGWLVLTHSGNFSSGNLKSYSDRLSAARVEACTHTASSRVHGQHPSCYVVCRWNLQWYCNEQSEFSFGRRPRWELWSRTASKILDLYASSLQPKINFFIKKRDADDIPKSAALWTVSKQCVVEIFQQPCMSK